MRDTANTLQRIHHAEHGPRTPLTTVASIVTREEFAVQTSVEQWTTQTLQAGGFAGSGIPVGDTVVPAPSEINACLPPEAVEAARIPYNANPSRFWRRRSKTFTNSASGRSASRLMMSV